MASETDFDEKSSRRGFLKMAAVSAPAALAAVAVSGTEAEATVEGQTPSGLQDTPHTRAYLASARF